MNTDSLASRWRCASIRVLGRTGVGALLLAAGVGAASAQDAWYVGIGGGVSLLEPNAADGSDVDENRGTAATLFLGRDMDERSSVQLQLHGLGEATFEDERTADYAAADASVLYRFFDSRDRSRGDAGVALYGRFGIGYLQRDSEPELDDDAPVWFGAGAGLEFALNRSLALRAEALYFDTDAGAGYLSVVGRFGHARRRPQPPSTPTAPAAPAPAEVPAPTSTPAPAPTPPDTPSAPASPAIADADGDGVADADDVCARSPRGYPVRANGCALFDGTLSGVRFADQGTELLPGSTDQLDYLVDLLTRFPQSRIEIHAHTDTRGTPRDQAIITRGRLRAVGTYLVSQGVSANRLVLRSFGGSRSLGEDQASDNRIEVIEHTR